MVIRAALALCILAGCAPELVDDTTRVDAPRLLAVRATPAEAHPGEAVTLRGLYADADGPVAAPPLSWAFCMNRKPFTEPGPVDPRCLAAEGAELVPIGDGIEAEAALPAEGCRLFGPDRPTPLPGEPAGRPVDPDDTGGFFQPVRVASDDASQPTLAQVRITCGLPSATPAQAAEYRRRQRPNQNPTLATVSADADLLVALEHEGGGRAVAPGTVVDLAATWPACAPDACSDGICPPCGGPESYAWFDPIAREVTTRRESIRVSWFATGGALETGHSGRSEEESERGLVDAEDRWTAPTTAGPAFLWVVVRDDRGGVGWATYRFDVGAP